LQLSERCRSESLGDIGRALSSGFECPLFAGGVVIAAQSSPDRPETNSLAESAFEKDALVAMKITRDDGSPIRSSRRRIR
jgi:hypothetical protein